MSVASKNLYDLLGNDEEGSETPTAPVKTVTKTSNKTGKANADGTGPAGSAPASGARSGARGGFSDNEHVFRDRGAGSSANQRKPTDENLRGGSRGGRGARGRGGRGATHHRNADDRHSKNLAPGSEKQAAQSWGATEGAAELNDEQAGEAIAKTDQKDAEAEDAEAEAQEPEVKQVTLDAWKAEQAANKLELNSGTSARKPNEGVNSKQEKAWAGKPLVRDADDDYVTPSIGKKQPKRKERVDNRFLVDVTKEQPTERPHERSHEGRGGRGGRGGERGERRGGAPRGGAPRGGAPRGGAPRGGDGFPRGGPRGGRGGASPINTNDTSAFPSLGSK